MLSNYFQAGGLSPLDPDAGSLLDPKRHLSTDPSPTPITVKLFAPPSVAIDDLKRRRGQTIKYRCMIGVLHMAAFRER